MQPESEHRINLSRRWEIVDETADQKSVWVDLSDLPLQAVPIRLRRKFNCPTGLDDTSIVCLTFTNIDGDSQVALNEKRLTLSLGSEREFESEDICQQLTPYNTLTLDVPTENGSAMNICLCIKTGT